VGIGYAIHAGQVIIADGTKEAAATPTRGTRKRLKLHVGMGSRGLPRVDHRLDVLSRAA
jgi:urocanate hydratase